MSKNPVQTSDRVSAAVGGEAFRRCVRQLHCLEVFRHRFVAVPIELVCLRKVLLSLDEIRIQFQSFVELQQDVVRSSRANEDYAGIGR